MATPGVSIVVSRTNEKVEDIKITFLAPVNTIAVFRIAKVPSTAGLT